MHSAWVSEWLAHALVPLSALQDLLWRARVTSEISLIKHTEMNNAATRAAAQEAERQRLRQIQAQKTKKVRVLQRVLRHRLPVHGGLTAVPRRATRWRRSCS